MRRNIALATAVALMVSCGGADEKKSDNKKEPTLAALVEDSEKKDEKEIEAPQPKNRISEKVFLLNGNYFSENFHGFSPKVSRSLEIKGNTFVSKVFGLAPGTMNVIAVQEDFGHVVENEDGTVDLVLKESDCDGAPEFVAQTARKAQWTDLVLEDGKLAAGIMEFL